MEKLIVLGTGNAMVTNCYNTCFALKKKEEYFLVDAGGGNQILKILEDKKIDIDKITNIFVTHAHTDHILGIIWVIRKVGQSMLQGKYQTILNIYCHKELIEKITTICELTLQKKFTNLFGNKIIFNEVKDKDNRIIMGERFTFFDILSTKEKQFGFQVIDEKNRKITCLGDEPLNEMCEIYAKDSYFMLSEAFCMYKDREIYKPYEKHHSTVKDAAQIAERLNVKNLVLWHTEADNLEIRKEEYTKEAKQYYRGKVYVPDDLEEINI